MHGFAPGEVIGRLVWVGLLHSAWLAFAVASALALGFWLVPGLSRRHRYAALLIGLAVVCLGPVALTARQHLARETVDDQTNRRAWIISPDQAADTRLPPKAPVNSPARPSVGWRFADQARGVLDQASRLIRAARPWGLIAWTTGVSVLGAWLGLGGLGVRRLVRGSRPASEAIQSRARTLSTRLGLTVVPAVRTHPNLREPCLSGVVRQAVLLPGGWLSRASDPELDAVLAHELAHARRLDPLVNLTQRLVEVALFFHPGVRWLSKALRSERELCTDALAVGATGDPLGLALALESVARFRLESDRNWTSKLPSVALGGDGLPLFSRIQELIGMTPTRPRLSAWPFAAIPTAVVLGLIATSVGSAQEAPKPPPKVVEAPRVAEAPAPAPVPRLRTAIKPEEPQISYEFRVVDINYASMERLNREGITQFKLFQDKSRSEICVIDPKALKSLVNTAIADGPPFGVVQSPRMTSLEGMRAAFVIDARKLPKEPPMIKHPVGPGDLLADFSGKINPGAIELSLEVETIREGANRGESVLRSVATTVLVPEDSSLVVSLGRQERKLETRTVVEETLVVVTPRRIIPEAEEERVGGRPSKGRRINFFKGAFW